MPRGRPVRSTIRQNIVEILSVTGPAYGYHIFQVYQKVFPRATMRSIYYHLTKGAELGIFQLDKVQMEKGDYSWGKEAEKVYYKLGPKAKALGDARVKEAVSAKTL